jgi:hypothetical protein
LTVPCVVLVLGLAGGRAAFYFLTRPNPVMTVKSQYAADAAKTPAGAIGTTFQISGSKFSDNSAITFLLDGQPVAGAPAIQSDASGNMQAKLPVTDKWAVGAHTLTARDASSYATKSGVPIIIVNQGEAGTHGPNGAPTDSASFQLQVTVQPQDASTGAQLASSQHSLTISGPNGKVCDPKGDTGQPATTPGTTSSGVSYQLTYAFTCSGTYKGGKISHIEKATIFKVVYSNGLTCTMTTLPFINQEYDGSFTDGSHASGTFNKGKRGVPGF